MCLYQTFSFSLAVFISSVRIGRLQDNKKEDTWGRKSLNVLFMFIWETCKLQTKVQPIALSYRRQTIFIDIESWL